MYWLKAMEQNNPSFDLTCQFNLMYDFQISPKQLSVIHFILRSCYSIMMLCLLRIMGTLVDLYI